MPIRDVNGDIVIAGGNYADDTALTLSYLGEDAQTDTLRFSMPGHTQNEQFLFLLRDKGRSVNGPNSTSRVKITVVREKVVAEKRYVSTIPVEIAINSAIPASDYQVALHALGAFIADKVDDLAQGMAE